MSRACMVLQAPATRPTNAHHIVPSACTLVMLLQVQRRISFHVAYSTHASAGTPTRTDGVATGSYLRVLFLPNPSVTAFKPCGKEALVALRDRRGAKHSGT